jgi:hypothetical protein
MVDLENVEEFKPDFQAPSEHLQNEVQAQLLIKQWQDQNPKLSMERIDLFRKYSYSTWEDVSKLSPEILVLLSEPQQKYPAITLGSRLQEAISMYQLRIHELIGLDLKQIQIILGDRALQINKMSDFIIRSTGILNEDPYTTDWTLLLKQSNESKHENAMQTAPKASNEQPLTTEISKQESSNLSANPYEVRLKEMKPSNVNNEAVAPETPKANSLHENDNDNAEISEAEAYVLSCSLL